MADFDYFFDFRLLDISLEIDTIKSQYELFEEQISIIVDKEISRVKKLYVDENYEPNDPEWLEITRYHEERIKVDIPRFFRNSFLLPLYAVFESAVIEIANHLQAAKGIGSSLNETTVNSFLERAKKYYKDELDFVLYENNQDWVYVNYLVDIRNAIAHSNARIEPLNKSLKIRILKLINKNNGIQMYHEYFVVEKEFATNMMQSVISILASLVSRYKEWDDMNKSA